eukprot:scaffold14156_cov56-Phaeocystis_antarctica.AAC.3
MLEVMLAQSFEHFELAFETAGSSSEMLSRAKGWSHGGNNTNAVALVNMLARNRCPDPGCRCPSTLAKGPAGAQRPALKQQDCRRLVALLGKEQCGIGCVALQVHAGRRLQ